MNDEQSGGQSPASSSLLGTLFTYAAPYAKSALAGALKGIANDTMAPFFDALVERIAERLCDEWTNGGRPGLKGPWDQLHEGERRTWRDIVRFVLTSAPSAAGGK